MTTDPLAKILAKLDEDIKGVESWLLSVIEVNEEGFFQREIARAKTHLAITKALRRQVEKHISQEGLCATCFYLLSDGELYYPCTFTKEVAHDLGIVVGE